MEQQLPETEDQNMTARDQAKMCEQFEQIVVNHQVTLPLDAGFRGRRHVCMHEQDKALPTIVGEGLKRMAVNAKRRGDPEAYRHLQIACIAASYATRAGGYANWYAQRLACWAVRQEEAVRIEQMAAYYRMVAQAF